MKFEITVSYRNLPETEKDSANYDYRLRSDFDDESAEIVNKLLIAIDEKIRELRQSVFADHGE